MNPTRRTFLKSAAAATALAHPLSAAIARAATAADPASTTTLTDNWFHYRDSLDGPWEAWHGDEIATWQKVSLPHCFNHYDACDPDTPYYRGQGWYRTTIPSTLPANNGRVLLHFEGAGQTTKVWINSQLVGTHVGGYDEFVFDITDALKSAPIKGSTKLPANTVALTILTDNSRDLERSPSDLSDFSLYGGLYRKVHLVPVPEVSIESVRITPTGKLGDPVKLGIKTTFYNPDAVMWRVEQRVYVVIKDPSGKTIAEQNAPLDATINLQHPELWSPGSPRLYTCTVSYQGSVITTRFGLKHAEFLDHGPFHLNGERLFLRGTQRHMDHAGYAAAQPEALVEQELRLMKEMGVNFLRLGHYQQTKQVLDLCDELGILVWEEAPWCRSGIGDKQWQDQTKQAFTNTILQHYNHPCVLIWGLGNEDDWPNEYPSVDQAAIRDFMQQMQTLAKTLDPNRHTSFRRCDFARDIPDTYSPSIWAGWYSGVYTEYQKSLEKERERVKHLLHIEWGADSHARRHAEDPYIGLPHIDTGKGTAETGLAYRNTGGPARISRDGDWSETYACDLFDWHLKVQETLDWFAGSAQWIFKDFTTPLRPENPVPRINQKGLLERDLTKKEAFYVFQSFWTDEKTAPMAHIYGHTWPVRWGDPNQPRTVKVYSNCPTAELFLNGKSMGTKKRNSQDFPAAGLRWEIPFVEGKNHLKVIATSTTGRKITDEVDFTYQTTKWTKPAKFQLAELSRTATTITAEATLHDEHGTLCLDSRALVRFSLAGPGKLIDNQGTSSGSRQLQLYNGRARITLTTSTGPNTLAITSEGLPTTNLTLS